MDHPQMGLIEINVKAALQESGCPICRVCRESEIRYLKSLFAYTNADFSTRMLISGFCRRHAWQLLTIEVSDLGGVPLANSIVYGDLVREVRKGIERPLFLFNKSNNKSSWQAIIRRFLNRVKTISKDLAAFPVGKGCRACKLNREQADRSGLALVHLLSLPVFQELYSASDGVCLPHAGEILASGETNPGLLFLRMDIRDRLMILETEMGEFVRKQSVEHRDEEITDPERTAVKRAVAFFVGEPE